MNRLKRLPSDEKDIIFLDLREYDEDKTFFREILHRTSIMLREKSKPQLLLADFSGISYTHKLFEITKDFISQNLDNIEAAAFNGIQLEQEIDPDIISKASAMNILLFSDLNDAKNWLLKK